MWAWLGQQDSLTQHGAGLSDALRKSRCSAIRSAAQAVPAGICGGLSQNHGAAGEIGVGSRRMRLRMLSKVMPIARFSGYSICTRTRMPAWHRAT